MQRDFVHRWTHTEILLSVLTLFVLLFFNYGILVRAPYVGFHFDPTNGRVLGIYVENNASPSLQIGDVLVRVGSTPWQEYHENGRQRLFEDVKKGDIVEIVVNREGRQLTTSWEIPGISPREFSRRFFNVWWLAYAFWLVGTAAQLLMRPRTAVRQLLVAANYLTGIWLMVGTMSWWHLWESSILLHALTWLLLPAYLHFHWVVPKPLRPLSKQSVISIYSICLLLAVAEVFQLLPRQLYALAFLLAMLGSMSLLIAHFIKQPGLRREVGFMLAAAVLIIIPLISFSISGVDSKVAPITFLALPFLPLSYFYTVYRSQLGGLELRVNRLITTYAFLILVGAGLLLLVGPITLQISHEAATFLAMATALLTAFFSIAIFPGFQRVMDRYFLGIKLPYQNLQETYSGRIATSTSIDNLLKLLEDEVFPSLLIRQYAFIQTAGGSNKPLLVKNVPTDQLPNQGEMDALAIHAGKYIPVSSSKDAWIRLVLPLKAGDTFIGFWLLGRRDPDDHYALVEIPILQSMASQTAIAVSNIMHTELLRKLYQSNIERYENERLRLALELHDSILNELAVLRTNLDDSSLSPRFQASYEEVAHRLREIVSDLRPPMLIYGLKPAIVELADNLMERSGDKVRVKADLDASEERVPEQMEQHLFRIVQEACENGLRHSNAKNITIYGTITPEKVDLNIQDDGRGFEIDSNLEMNNLLANRHFGLAGMIERAHLIDARIDIHSRVGTGTRIYIKWTGNQSDKKY